MTTETITVPVDARAAQIFKSAPEAKRQKLGQLLRFHLLVGAAYVFARMRLKPHAAMQNALKRVHVSVTRFSAFRVPDAECIRWLCRAAKQYVTHLA